jgi:myo-inositol-1(or 4)-monophosphatase
VSPDRPTSEPPRTADLLGLAESIAREAGASLRDAFSSLGSLEVSTKSTATDLVSDADVATERLIRARLHESRPGDAILGEEGGEGEGTTGLRWVVDPLDGTVNFLFGIPQWAVSIACEDADAALAGVVYDAVRDEMWSARRDGPATLNGVPLHGSGRTELATALVSTGFGYDAAVREVQAATVARLLPHVRDIRRFGSAALDLVWCAAGRYDAFYERGLNAWDLAAGGLVCERAGLAVLPLAATPPTGPGILVAPPAIASELAALVAD